MSASIDKDPAAEGEDTRGVLAGWLDDYIGGRCDRGDMQASFMSVCRSNPDAPWDALALLDQYQRRGRLDTALVRGLKADIAQLVFGVAHQTRSQDGEDADDTADAQEPTDTGTRWRRLLEDVPGTQTPGSTASGEAEAARTDPAVPLSDPVASLSKAPSPAAPHFREAAPPRGTIERGVLRKRYELLSILGRGRTGTVYKALDRHRSHLDEPARFVAIKILKTNYQEHPEALVELEREFHEAQTLSHPNIAKVFDLDRGGGLYYIVMELLEGELLADVLGRLDGRRMQREYALGILADIGAALAYAHRQGIVHGDLKPRNVMLTRSGEVRVLNFGFARSRLLELHGTSEPHDLPVPAPAYASIDRISGDRPDQSDDVYSLACVSYELLSGRHPFAGRPAVSARAHGRRPERIRGLSRRQWHALRRALSWAREARGNVAELLAVLGCAERSNLPVAPDQIVARPDAGRRWRMILPGVLIVLASGAILLSLRPDLTAAVSGFVRDTASQVPWPSRLPWPAWRSAEPAAPVPPAPVTDGVATGLALDSEVGSPMQEDVGDRAPPVQEPSAAPAEPGTPVAARGEAQPRAGAPGSVSIEFDQDAYVVTESDTAAYLRIRRRGSARAPITFTWNLRGNSAEPGADFANIGPVTERMPAGVREATIAIPLVSDAIVENTELFLVEIESVQEGVNLAERSHAAVIIVDDD